MNNDRSDSQLIKRHLLQNYGLGVDKITAGPRGFVAETYIVEVGKDKYFVKMVRKGRYDHNLVKSVEVQNKLCQLGLKRIPCPITSKSGTSSTELGEFTFILFNYIEGNWVRDYKSEELLDIITELHKINPELVGEIAKESFDLPYSSQLKEILERVFSYNSGSEVETKTRKYLEPFKQELDRDWANFNRLVESCKTGKFDLRITHEDPWGNVLRSQDGGIYLFDWDDIALAPVERDMWFKLGEPRVATYYKKSFPSYEVNKLAYDFYLFNRYFYDLYGFLVEIFSDQSNEHKNENYKLLFKDWHDWLRALVRKEIGSYL